MRVSSGNIYAALSRSLTDANSRAQKATMQVGSGQTIVKASDNPVDASQLLRLDSELSRTESHQRSITDASAWLATADSAVADMTSVLQRANDLSISAMNASRGSGERAAISAEIRSLRTQLASSANATYLGQAVFAGYSGQAVDPTSFAFTGTTGEVLRRIDSSTTLSASVDGKEMLGFNAGAGKDVFTVLEALAVAVDDGSLTGLQAARTDLDASFERVVGTYEVIGTRTQAIERVSARLDRSVQETTTARAAIGEIDLPKAMLEMQSAQTAYQTALAAVAKATMPTLADYL